MNKNTIKAPCTILLAAVNIIVFLVLSFLGMTEDGEFMLKHGAMYVPYLIQRGEYYRLFSSMFLHFGYDHLVNNMIVLVAMGWNLELDIGKVKFLIVYFVSGLAGECSVGMVGYTDRKYGYIGGGVRCYLWDHWSTSVCGNP